MTQKIAVQQPDVVLYNTRQELIDSIVYKASVFHPSQDVTEAQAAQVKEQLRNELLKNTDVTALQKFNDKVDSIQISAGISVAGVGGYKFDKSSGTLYITEGGISQFSNISSATPSEVRGFTAYSVLGR